MRIKILILALIVFNSIKGQDEPSLASYDKLNTFEMISESQSFKINTSEPSIAYFDSFDGNSIVYITKDKEKFMNQTDERITGKFYPIEPNVEYYVRNNLYDSFYSSTFKKYLYPTNLSSQNISIVEEKINYLYLRKNNPYNLDFKSNTIKKIIKLSRKTPNSIVTIKNKEDERILSNESLYYQLEDKFTGVLELQVEEEDAFLEFLSSEGDFEIIRDVEKMNYEIKKKTTLIKIDKTQKDFLIQLNSDKPFKFAFSYGFSNNENYYYSFDSTPNIVSQKEDNTYMVLYKINTPFKNIELKENEFFSFSVNVEFEENQKVLLFYKQDSELTELIEEKLEKDYCEQVKENLKELFELYVFTDIAKCPPTFDKFPNYHHKPIDIQQSLENINCENRYFYEFYQEVMKILTATKDIHLNIYSYKTPKGIIFEQYAAALPFIFEIKNSTNDAGEVEYKMYITPSNFLGSYEESVQNFILDHVNIPLKTIDEQDPFDYFQNWSKYTATKNIHAQFTYLVSFNVLCGFYLRFFPFDYSDLNLKQFEFEDNRLLRIPYYIIKPNVKDVEFNEYFHNYLKEEKNQVEIINFPFIDEIREKYLIHKGIKKIVLKEDEKQEIEWNVTISGDSGFLKCRVDEINQVNVVLQTSFSLNYYLGIAKIIECAKLFHTNEYPIIIIESQNGGGSAQLYMVMHQLFQMRTVDRTYFSFRMSEASKEFYKGDYWERTDIRTCEILKNYDDYKEVTDQYDCNGNSVNHIRNDAVDILPFYFRTVLRDYREEYLNNESLKKNLKKPTDIIIFTDSYSYSATCGLIKGFQNTGGAIIVGYFGNPKIKGIDLFDGSQSISSVSSIQNFHLYPKLYNLGIYVGQVTVGESFDDSAYGVNPIPREYAIDPVDYRVDIYSSYSDDLYSKFIDEGKRIHAMFNEENYCNAKNDKLLLHSDTCTFEGNPKAHGGYKCNPETNKWDTSNCQPYYCDIGYFFDQVKKECVEECGFNDTKSYFFYEGMEKKKTYPIENDKLTIFSFVTEKPNNYYFYRCSKDIIPELNKIGFYKSGTIKINENRNESDAEFMIDEIQTDFVFQNIRVDSFTSNIIKLFNQKMIWIFQSSEEQIFYSNDIFNNQGNQIKYAVYNDEMKPEDIILGNDQYFNNYTDNIIYLEKDKINILYMNHSFIDQIHYYFDIKNNSQKIAIEGKDTNILYLQKDKEYLLDFKNNAINRMIKLSRKTINSEIKIIDENIVLNSKNLYYQIKDDFKGEIKLQATKDAIIEFQFKLPDVAVLDYEQLNTNSSQKYNLIKIPKKYSGQDIVLNLKNNLVISINAFFGYSKPPYSYYYNTVENINTLSVNNNTANLLFPVTVESSLMKDEYYCVLIENLVEGNLEIIGDYQNKDKSKDKKGLETWLIVLIIAASVVALLIIIILIVCCCSKKNQLSNKEIEEKMENLNEIKEL